MKKILYILLILLSCGTLWSCKDWLEVTPFDEVAAKDLYKTETGVQEALNGLYLQMLSRGLYGRELTMGLPEVLAQHYYIPKDHHYEKIAAYDYADDKSEGILAGIWSGMYKLIGDCNTFLEQIEIYQDSYKANFNLYKGEALALRAYLYLDLLRLFGPVYNEANKTKEAVPYYSWVENSPTPILTAEEIAEKILLDVNEAITLLANDPILTNEDGVSQGETFWDFRNIRLNLYAAYALKARICVHIGNKREAYQIASSLLQSKFPEDMSSNNFMNIFPSTWSFVSTPNFDRVGWTEMLFAMHDLNREELQKNTFGSEANEYQVLNMGDARYNEIFPGQEDFRNWTWVPSTSIGGSFLRTSVKYATARVSSINLFPYQYEIIPLIRKGELYLIAAETSPDDYWKRYWLEEFRKTRGYLNNNTSNYDLDILLQEEYEREFYTEGQYFYFLKRHNIGLIPTQEEGGTVTLSEDKYYIPLPRSERDKRY